MVQRVRRWTRVKALTAEEKAGIAAACQRLIDETLKPRFLPQVQPTEFNYPVDIFGRWRGRRCSFITRYRSGFADNAGVEFDAAFTRLDHIEQCITQTRFDVMWHRHTGQWYCLHSSVTLDEALRLVASEQLLQPSL